MEIRKWKFIQTMKLNRMSKNKKVLVVGGTGFIGFHLCNFFLKKKYKVFSISLNKPKKIRKVTNVKYFNCNIGTPKEIAFLKKMNFDYIINCGGYVDHYNKKKTLSSHFSGCKNLFKIFKKKKIKLFIQIGSSAEYGSLESPHVESKIGNASDIYGKAKLLSTKYLYKKKFPFVILRLYQLYGPHQDDNRFIPFVINSCLRGLKFPCSEGTQSRDFLHIDDFLRAINLLIKSKNSIGEIFNLGSGKPIKLKKLITKINQFIKKGQPEYGKIKMRTNEQKIVYPSIKKINKLIGWTPKINIDKGLRKTILYFRRNKKKSFNKNHDTD